MFLFYHFIIGNKNKSRGLSVFCLETSLDKSPNLSGMFYIFHVITGNKVAKIFYYYIIESPYFYVHITFLTLKLDPY